MQITQKLRYETPDTVPIEIKAEGVICSSSKASMSRGWEDVQGDPWVVFTLGDNALGGWTDLGGSAWD